MSRKKTKKEYIEMKVINWNSVFLILIGYPILLLMGITSFFFNFIRYNLKLLFYLIVSIIPIINSSIISPEISTEDLELWTIFDEFKFTMDNILYTKKYEVKNG